MFRIVHLSDLHFGRADQELLRPLLRSMETSTPDLIVISGDLTQRARRRQFVEARQFLSLLTKPVLVIPGNHDIPWNPVERFFSPFEKYRRYISQDLEPNFSSKEAAIFCINTARNFERERGDINPEQLDSARRFFAHAEPGATRVVVTHHPFDLPVGVRSRYRVKNASRAMHELTEMGVDLFLAGHAHRCFSTCSTGYYRMATRSSVIVQAGTSISTRVRGEPNSFNVLELSTSEILIHIQNWDSERKRFVEVSPVKFVASEQDWVNAA
jgi:3',5'-cyclic AMP phosphodiesterase CpdA